MNEFTHKIATLDDIPAIEKLMTLSINQLLGPLLTKDQLEASFDSMGLDDQLIKDETYFMIFSKNYSLGAVDGAIEKLCLAAIIHPTEMINF